jgi:hypothetical protein
LAWATASSSPSSITSGATRSTVVGTRRTRTLRLSPARGIDAATIATLFRGAGQHPSLATLGHLAAGHVSVAIHGVESAAASAATRTTRTTTAESTASATAATATRSTAATTARTAGAAPTPAIAVTTTVTTATVVARITAATGLWAGHQIDNVVKVALLLRVAGRSVLAGQNAHQAHVSNPLARDRQGLHQTRQSIASDVHRRGYRLGLWTCTHIGRRRRFLGGSLFGGRFLRGSLLGGRFRSLDRILRLCRGLCSGLSGGLALAAFGGLGVGL